MTDKSKKILSEISPGELLDKLSILEIKLDKISDKDKHELVKKEYASLIKVRDLNINLTDNVKDLFENLKKINLNLWDIEDKIRICEKNKTFDKNFIELARNVYLNNDKRAKIKYDINKILDSKIQEIKQYIEY